MSNRAGGMEQDRTDEESGGRMVSIFYLNDKNTVTIFLI